MPPPPEYPNQALLAKRDSLRDLPLTLTRGALPAGLAGHLFVISPVGSVDSGGAPYPNGNDRPTVINGDGMVWRFDLGAAGVSVSAEIVKPPDYFYDELTRDGQPLDFAGFGDMGMLRASLFLGTRNFANTAFVPMPQPGGPPRLICCYDAGPPVEIDPATLETLEVVGQSWDAEALDGLVAFPPILATAHPMYDPKTGQFFAVNYGRSTLSMLETVPFFEALAFLPEAANYALGRIAAIIGKAPFVPTIAGAASKALAWLGNAASGFAPSGGPEQIVPKNFLDLVVWTGTGDITRLSVIDMATGKEAVVEQSMHQIACTRRYVLLLDTNFKLRLDQFYNNPFPNVPEFERLIRTSLASQQGSTSNIWVIRRDAVDAALKAGDVSASPAAARGDVSASPAAARGDVSASPAAARGANRSVPAWKVPLLGAVHFLADYDDADGIRIQCAHGNALDIAEWLRKDDQRLSGESVRQQMHGMVAGAVDVSQLGQYVIDPEKRRIVDWRRIANDEIWGIALYAGKNVPAWDAIPERLTHAFWFGTGLWDDTYTLFVRSLYASYLDRVIPLSDVDRMIKRGGMPSSLFTVDLESFQVCDQYNFGSGVSLSSPQFVPDPARTGDRGGWITTIVWTTDTTSLWVFDAEKLAAGPIAELAMPAGTTLGFTLHTCWLPTLAAPVGAAPVGAPLRGARREVDAADTLRRRMAHLKPKARKRIEDLLAKRTKT